MHSVQKIMENRVTFDNVYVHFEIVFLFCLETVIDDTHISVGMLIDFDHTKLFYVKHLEYIQ